MKDDLITRQLAKLFISQARKEKPVYKVDAFLFQNQVMNEQNLWNSLVSKKKNTYVEKQ